jgi:hypothetical protein
MEFQMISSTSFELSPEDGDDEMGTNEIILHKEVLVPSKH